MTTLTRQQKITLFQTLSNIAGGNVSKVYYKHGVLYGDYFDLRIYGNVKTTFYPTNTDKSKRTEGIKRDDSLARARVSLYRLITANTGKHGRFKTIFATYTFKQHTKDLNTANSRLKYYFSKLRKHTRNNPKYVAVPEKQESGSWHYHIIYFNQPKISIKLNDKLWDQGTKAVKLEYPRGINNIALYLAGYLTKQMLSDRPLNKKLYYSSRGLIRPIDVFNTDTIDTILNTGHHRLLSVFEGNNYTQTKYKINI